VSRVPVTPIWKEAEIDAPTPQSGFSRWLVDPVLKGLISLQTGLVDAKFVRRQGLQPSVSNRILQYPALGYERISRTLEAERQDLLFERFGHLHGRHYGPEGRGYQGIVQSDPADREQHYRSQFSRLEYFADEFADFLHYEDGDTFADLGCGTGQNIQFLCRRYPNSPIIGSDFNNDAVGLIREFEQHPTLQLSVGDLRDEAFLNSVLASPVDHIVLSHVFSLVFAESLEQTLALRQQLIDRFVASSRKSVVILDNFGGRDQKSIKIEQKQRAVITDDVMSYFMKHADGRTIMAQSERSQAVIFCKKQQH